MIHPPIWQWQKRRIRMAMATRPRELLKDCFALPKRITTILSGEARWKPKCKSIAYLSCKVKNRVEYEIIYSMKAFRRFVAPSMAIVMLLASWMSVRAQSVDIQYFPETGHNIRGDFLQFYKSVKDPKLVFGYPITEQITSKDGKTIQYFQRARFERRSDLPEGQRVQLTPLGQKSYEPGG